MAPEKIGDGLNSNWIKWVLGIAVLGGGVCASGVAAAVPRLQYNRDVRPILSDKCFKCHGPDARARKARLRLDQRADALAEHADGATPIVPGRPEASELVLRIESKDDDERMPPAESNMTLTRDQIATLRRWVAEGAEYQAHWSFVAPVATSVSPSASGPDGAAERRRERETASSRRLAVPLSLRPGANAIDAFVDRTLVANALSPSAETDKATLLRRVSLDLTGLPPTLEELDAFLADTRDDAYQRVVDRLLASPRYGERMATDWLDAARYADSNGFFRDNARQIWPWRDWVINAFNRNQPFDQFTIEQLAGDLLPEATQEQRIATGFNRNHMVSGETGIIDEEYRVEYVADRAETTSAVWLGLTVGCARCHDHKFDPITQRDYYQLFAFFNSGVEKGTITPDDPPPVMDVASPAQRAELQELRGKRLAADKAFDEAVQPLQPAIAAWETHAMEELAAPREKLLAHVDFEADNASARAENLPRAVEKGGAYTEPGIVGHSARFDGMQHFELPPDIPLDADKPWAIGVWLKATNSLAAVISKIEPAGNRRGFEVIWAKGQLQINLVDRWVVSAIEVITREPVKKADWNHVIISYDGSRRAAGLHVYADGLEMPFNVARDSLQGSITNQEPVRIGRRDSGLGFYGQLDEVRLLGATVGPAEARTWFWSERLAGVLTTDPGKRDARQKKLVLECYVERHGEAPTRAAYQSAERARQIEDAFRAKLPKTLVMQETTEPRATHILKRGQYDAPGEAVLPNVPGFLPPLPGDAPRTRLGLARWLVSPANPLTARVEVNRLWLQCFGEGLVATVNDFGSQGEAPTHPGLLDWLAIRFVQSGWNVKELLELIVTSATYRQTSAATPALLQRDPANRLLARGPRFRLSGEMIRDQALAVSGLLVDKLGGPPVKPYQPPGLWEAVSYNGELSYTPDRDDGLWRRTVYSFWKRTAPPPGVQVLDGPTRETCVVRRPRTNTPLQALLLLNDETFVEAARVLATRVIEGRGAGDEGRAREMFRRATARIPNQSETSALTRLLARERARFSADREAAKRLVNVGFSPRGKDLEAVELASWTAVAQVVLNLDEMIVRR